jgi:tRNA-dihydrouridine synthase B
MKYINNLFDSNVFLAPMAGITDKAMRRITSELGDGVMVSEMVAVNSISHKNPNSYKIAYVKDEPYPVVVQLVGNIPDNFVKSLPLIEELGARSIDINMGCPVKKIINNQSGSYLMKDIKLASDIISTCVKNSNLPVSVKFRKGWDENSVNAVEFAKMCEDNGASYVTIHGRTRKQLYSGKADWDIIGKIKQRINIPVIGNGDIVDIYSAKEMILHTNVDGVMIGRAAQGRPWLINQIHQYINHGKIVEEPSLIERQKLLLKHIDYMCELYGKDVTLKLTRKHVSWYIKNLRNATDFRVKYVKINNFEAAIYAINEFFNKLKER